MFKFLFLFISNYFIFVHSQGLIDCGFNDTLNLEAGTWVRYESSLFPQSMIYGPETCELKMNFITKNIGVWIIPVNALLTSFTVSDSNPNFNGWGNVDTNTQVLTYLTRRSNPSFSIYVYNTSKWEAFQSIIVATDDSSTCPLNGQTINMTDSSIIIPITPTFDSLNSNETTAFYNASCTWTFVTSPEYNFKFIYRYSNFLNNGQELFTVKLDDGLEKNITANYKYGKAEPKYFDARKLTFNYIGPQRPTLYYFYAIVTVVKKVPEIGNNNCNGTYLDLMNGYNNFESCINNFTQPANTQTRYKVELYSETCCDKLIIGNGNYSKEIKANSIINIDRSVNNYYTKWTTDGSIRQAGFKLTPTLIKCENETKDFIVSCNGSIVVVGFEQGYCNNMFGKYKFTIENHCTDNLMFTVNANLRSQTNDKIVMLRNGNISWTFYGNDGNTSLSTGGPGSDIYQIDFTSLSSSDDIVTEGGWWWNFIIYTMPAVPKLLYNLNDAAPTLHFQLSQLLSGQEISVTVDPNRDLEMFIVGNDLENLTNFIFYESLDHSQFIGSFANKSLFIYNGSTLYAAKYLPKSKVLTVQNTLGQGPCSYSVVYFRIAQSVNTGCTNNNVYSLPSTNAMLAFPYNPSTICKYSIVVYGYSLAIDIDQVYSNSSDLVQVIGENYNQTVNYFSFNDDTAEDWKNLQFHATVLNFIVTKNTQATILYGNQWVRQYYNVTQVNSFINQTNIVTSPGYGGLYFDHLSDFFVTQIHSTYKQSSFLLSVVSQNVSFSGALTLEGYGPSSIDLKTISNQQPFLVNVSNFNITYRDPNFSNFLISYQLLEGEGQTATTTTIAASTTTKKNGGSSMKFSFIFIALLIFIYVFANNEL